MGIHKREHRSHAEKSPSAIRVELPAAHQLPTNFFGNFAASAVVVSDIAASTRINIRIDQSSASQLLGRTSRIMPMAIVRAAARLRIQEDQRALLASRHVAPLS